MCVAHTVAVIILLMAGFVLLNAVLIIIGHKVVGISGIALLGIIPLWYSGMTYLEFTGQLEDPLK
jgi:hypothetical protein